MSLSPVRSRTFEAAKHRSVLKGAEEGWGAHREVAWEQVWKGSKIWQRRNEKRRSEELAD